MIREQQEGKSDGGEERSLGECLKTGTGPNGGSVGEDANPLSAAPNVPFASELTDQEIERIAGIIPAGEWSRKELYARKVGIEIGLRYARDKFLHTTIPDTSDMTDAELDAELRRFGYDPAEVVRKGVANFRRVLEEVQRKTPSCASCSSHYAEDCPNICAYAKNGKQLPPRPVACERDDCWLQEKCMNPEHCPCDSDRNGTEGGPTKEDGTREERGPQASPNSRYTSEQVRVLLEAGDELHDALSYRVPWDGLNYHDMTSRLKAWDAAKKSFTPSTDTDR